MMATSRSALVRLGALSWALLSAASACAAETIDAGPFSVDVAPGLAIRVNGVPLISGSRCAAFRGTLAGSPVLVDPAQGRIVRQGNAFTLMARTGRKSLRQEVVVTAEAVHITFELRAFGPTGGSHLEYDLLAPVASLDGVPAVWTAGAPRDHRQDHEATLDSKTAKAGEYAQRSVVYARLALPGGACSMDINPGGAWVGEDNYGETAAMTLWHDGQAWHFMSLCSGGQLGGTLRGKVVLRVGDVPYERVHRRDPVAYTSEFPVALALDFSEAGGDARYTACGTTAPAGAPYRWRDPAAVRLVSRTTGGLLWRDFATAARPGTEVVFEIEQPAGLYLMTLHVRDDEAATGPFTVSDASGPVLGDVQVERGASWIRTVPLRLRDGRTALRFSGDWKVNALTLQAILGEAEDFLFGRPYWNLPEPGE
jgi:hypothetical protein